MKIKGAVCIILLFVATFQLKSAVFNPDSIKLGMPWSEFLKLHPEARAGGLNINNSSVKKLDPKEPKEIAFEALPGNDSMIYGFTEGKLVYASFVGRNMSLVNEIAKDLSKLHAGEPSLALVGEVYQKAVFIWSTESRIVRLTFPYEDQSAFPARNTYSVSVFSPERRDSLLVDLKEMSIDLTQERKRELQQRYERMVTPDGN